MFTKVTGNTYIGKSKMSFIKNGCILEDETLISEIADEVIKFKSRQGPDRLPDYYITGMYLEPTEEDPAEFFQISVKNLEPSIHRLFITGIRKKEPSLDPYRLENCIWSSYYEDDLHGFLFQIVKMTIKPGLKVK